MNISRTSDLNVHERTQTGERPFKCQQCIKSFKCSSQLKLHERTHTGERPYKCHQCTKAFTQSINLKVHKRTHTGERPYKCHQCNKAFTHSSSLKVHERTHTGERPYKCQQCTRAFTYSKGLKRHERTHTEERQSDNRNKILTHADNLKLHERTHTSENNSTFSNDNEMKSPFKNAQLEEFPHSNISVRNLNKIKGEKGYSYQVYQNKFPMSSQVKRHQEIHERTNTTARPFKCDKCNKDYTEADDLKYHQCTHTEFPQQNIPVINQMTMDGANRNPNEIYHNKFPMNNQMSYHREIHSEYEATHSEQSYFNIQSSTSIHPEQHSFQDGITNQNFDNYPNLSTRFNAMNKDKFRHQFISQNIQPTISPLFVNLQTQGDENIPTLDERKDTNPFSFNTENGQNFNVSMSNTGISILNRSIEHPSESVSYSTGNIEQSFPLISKVTREEEISFDNFSRVSSEFDVSSDIFNLDTHHSMYEYQKSNPIKDALPETNITSIADNKDVNSQIKNISFLNNPSFSTQKQESFSTASNGLERNIPIENNVLEAIPWIEQSYGF